MIAFAMVVLDELGDGVSEVALPQRNDAVQTLFLDRPYKPFRVGVRIRGTLRRQYDANTCVAQPTPHLTAPLPIPIADQHTYLERCLVGHRQRPDGLLQEQRRWMRRRAEDLHPPRRQIKSRRPCNTRPDHARSTRPS